MPAWKQAIQKGVEATPDIVRGFAGMDPTGPRGSLGYNINAGTQILDAGLPFLALTKGKPALHGTGRVFDYFDAAKNDTTDLMGHMFHAAGPRDYDYVNSYINGKGYGMNATHKNPNVIPIVPKAENVLDLFTPNLNPDDMAAAVASVPNDWRRRSLIDDWKNRIREGSENNTFVQNLQSRLNDPSIAKNMPFDAVRYSDIGYESYAIPPKTPMATPWGTPLTKDAKDIQIVKLPHNFPTKSELTYHTTPKKPQGSDPWEGAKVHHPDYGYLDEEEASQLVGGGELSMNWYEKHFPSELPSHQAPTISLLNDKPGGPTIQPSHNIVKQPTIPSNKSKPFIPRGPSHADNIKINSAYSPEKGKNIINEAEKLGVNWNSYANYQDIEAAIIDKLFENLGGSLR